MNQSPQSNPSPGQDKQPEIKTPDANLTDAQKKEAAEKAKGGVNFNSKT